MAAFIFAAAYDAFASSNTPAYSPSGGVLNATAFEQWLVAHSVHSSTLILVPGRYRVPAPSPGAPHMPLLSPLSNVVVEMTGVTLIMESRIDTALKVSNWDSVVLRGSCAD